MNMMMKNLLVKGGLMSLMALLVAGGMVGCHRSTPKTDYSTKSSVELLLLSTVNEYSYTADTWDGVVVDDFRNYAMGEMVGLTLIKQELDEVILKRLWILHKALSEQAELFICPQETHYFDPTDLCSYLEKVALYQEGGSRFPRSEVLSLMGEPTFEYAKANNHGDWSLASPWTLYLFASELLSPLRHIADVATELSNDGRAGILKLQSSYNSSYDVAVLLFETESGQIFFNLFKGTVDDLDHNVDEKVLHVCEEGHDYYIFYNEIYTYLNRAFLYEQGSFREVSVTERGLEKWIPDYEC